MIGNPACLYFGGSQMMRLVECAILGGQQGNDSTTTKEHNDELNFATVDVLTAEAERLRAEAVRLRAEARMFDDIGSHYKELASKAEAEAFIAQADRTTHEKVQEMVRVLKVKTRKNEKNEKGEEIEVEVETDELLVVAKARSEIERDIARNKDLATKTSNRSTNNRNYNGRNGASQRRNDKTVDSGKEGAGAQSSGPQGVSSKPFNVIKGAEAQAALRNESRT